MPICKIALVALVSCSTLASTGSVYRGSGPCPLHVGVRPATSCAPAGCDGAGLTIQASADPGCVDRPTPAEQKMLDDMAASAARPMALLEAGTQ